MQTVEIPDSSARAGLALLHGIDGPPDRSAIPVLIELLEDNDPFVRICAVAGLYHCGQEAKEVVLNLRRVLTDDHPVVRSFAELAIQRIDSDSGAEPGFVDP
jgi:HEAT repeat protein